MKSLDVADVVAPYSVRLDVYQQLHLTHLSRSSSDRLLNIQDHPAVVPLQVGQAKLS